MNADVIRKLDRAEKIVAKLVNLTPHERQLVLDTIDASREALTGGTSSLAGPGWFEIKCLVRPTHDVSERALIEGIGSALGPNARLTNLRVSPYPREQK